MSPRYFLVFKPYGVVCRFGKEAGKTTLGDLLTGLPRDAYPLGRLDEKSEGLLIISNDKSLHRFYSDPGKAPEKEYLVFLDGRPDPEKFERIASGMEISIKGKKVPTLPCRIMLLPEEMKSLIPPAELPIMKRAPEKTCWVVVQLNEGKNRQIRRMFGMEGLPALRIIRTRIGKLKSEGMLPGDLREISAAAARSGLGIKA